MKISKRTKNFTLLFLIIANLLLFPADIPPEFDGTNSKAVNFDQRVKTSAVNITDEINTIFTWTSNSSLLYNNSKEPLSLNPYSGNLTDFDPYNTTSYTNTDKISVGLRSSNSSWTKYRDFDIDSELPSTDYATVLDGPGEMESPYDTTVFFARNGTVYNITASWQDRIQLLGQLDANLYLFNQSQFHTFENYIQPWRIFPNIETIENFNSSHSSDDWLYDYSNVIPNPGLAQDINETIKFEITFNKTGWYYLVLWGPSGNAADTPKFCTRGELLTEGQPNVDLTVNDLMDLYRPSLGKVNGLIDMPEKVYERVVRGYDDTYGDSLAIIYIFEYAERKLEQGISDKADNDWVPYIVYINCDSVGQFPNRIVCFYDDSWADFRDRYIRIIDPSFSSGSGTHQYLINITGNLAPYLNETVTVNATVSTTPISMKDRLGASVRLATTTNSHGFEIKPYSDSLGTSFAWDAFNKYALNNTVLSNLYNDTFNEFISNNWMLWAGKYYPEKTPFTLYLGTLFTAPYVCSGLDNILLISPSVRNWIDLIDINNSYFNSSLEVHVNTTIDIPVNFELTYPEEKPLLGEESYFTLSLGEMGNPNITIDYSIDYNMSYSMGLFTGSYNITKNSTIFFEIPLQEINLILEFFGVEDGVSGLASREIQKEIDTALQGNNYLSIDNFLLGDHVVGNIVSCDITIHTWPIIKQLIKDNKIEWYPACLILDEVVLQNKTGLELILSPQLQGVVNGTLVGEGLSFNNAGFFEFDDDQQSMLFQVNRTQDFSPSDVQLQSIVYYLNFHIDWAFEVNFNQYPHYFGVEDQHWELGRYPNINFAQNPMDNSDNLTLSWTESATPPSAPTLSITTPSPTTNHTISLDWTPMFAADNYTLYRHTESITSSNLNSATEVKTIALTNTMDTVPGIGGWYYSVTATNESGSSIPSNSPYIDVENLQETTYAWNKTWGTVNGDYGNDVATDSTGNVYVVGSTNSFGAGGYDILLLKYNPSGIYEWNVTWGGTSSESGNGIAIDSSDYIYVVGYYSNTTTTRQDMALVKFNNDGAQIWNRTWGQMNVETDQAESITIDENDSIYVTGHTNVPGFGLEVVVIKYTTLGIMEWNVTWGGPEDEKPYDLAIDSTGNIYVTGYTSSYVSGWVMFIAKYNPFGVKQWNYTWGEGSATEIGRGIAINSDDEIFITGSSNGFTATSSAVLLKYSNTGVKDWHVFWTFTNTTSAAGYDLTIDSSDLIYITGYFYPNPILRQQMMLLQYNSMGTLLWNTTWGGTGDDNMYGITTDSSINLYVTGTTESYGPGSPKYNVELIKYLLNDSINPSVIVNSFDSQVELGIGVLNVQVNASDNYQVQSPVQIRFYEPDSTIIGTFNMTNPYGNIWVYAWNVGLYALGNNYYFRIIASDETGNINDSVVEYFDIVDTTNPSVHLISHETQVEVGFGSINIHTTISDNYQIQSPVQIRFYEPDSTIIGTYDMINPLGTIWNYTWNVGSNAPDINYYFRIIASDVNSNTNDTVLGFFDVIDTTNPSVVIHSYDDQAENGTGTINIQVNVTDNYQIQSPVQVRIYDPNSAIIGTFDMNNLYENLWDYTWNVGSYFPNDSYYFRILCRDMVDNLNDTVVGYFNIIEPPHYEPPQPPILSIITPSPTTSLFIDLEWTTSIGADNYTLYRYVNSINASNVHLASFVLTTTNTNASDIVPSIGLWYYAVIATNESGSSNLSNSPYIDVKEEPGPPDPPTLTITTPSPTTSLIISIEWTTSLGADNYSLYRYSSPITLANLHLATYVKTITEIATTDTVPGIGRWYYAVIATNKSGNSVPSNYDFIDVQEEQTPPEEPGAIPGYPLSYIGIVCLITTIIVYKKKYKLKI